GGARRAAREHVVRGQRGRRQDAPHGGSGSRLRQRGGAQLRGARAPRRVRRAGMPDCRRAVAQVVPRSRAGRRRSGQHRSRQHRSRQHGAGGLTRLGHGRSRDGGSARGCTRGPRARGGRDAPGGARRRRNSAVSSRRLMNWLTTLLRRPDIAWTDALDIAIVAILVYELLLLIRGTRAAQMALSAGFILLLYFLSQWLELETVNWVIRNLAAYVVFAIIFQPGSPLHDGAVIIQGDRIAAAACFLPLSVNPRVSRDLGTRHRAALGLTEENDAIAIVVSEETGTISLAIGGDFERGFNAEQLRSR